MANISAQMVAELRQSTGLGMMECKKALVEADGDINKATEILRVKSGAKASKAATRVASEGMVSVFVADDAKQAAIVEVNCETDFVAKDDNFTQFVREVAAAIVQTQAASLEDLALVTLANGKSIEQNRQELVAKVGENITIRRFELLLTTGNIVSYLHGKKIAVAVDITGGNNDLGKDLAMHIAASKPICVSSKDVSEEVIANERSIYTQQAANSGKPANIISKMVEGRVNKYLAEITLLGQYFVKNPDLTVADLLQEQKAAVNKFVMFTLGEGIEKKVVDFRAEVAAASQVD